MNYKISQYSKDKNVFTIHFYELSVTDVKEFKDIFKPFRSSKDRKVILDFCGTSFISPEIIGLLLDYRATLAFNNGILIIKVNNLDLSDLLYSVELNKIIPICDSFEACYKKIDWEDDEVTEKVKLNFTPTLNLVPSIRNFASRLAKSKGFSDSESYRIQTVVDELCTNAVEHGFWSKGDKARISLYFTKSKIEIFVHSAIELARIDKFKGVVSSERPCFETEGALRGRGVGIVKMLSDKFDVKVFEDKTVIRVVKNREI